MSSQGAIGRSKNVSEVTRAGLRFFKNGESKMIALKNTPQEGLNSPIMQDFNFEENLKKLKAEKRKHG